MGWGRENPKGFIDDAQSYPVGERRVREAVFVSSRPNSNRETLSRQEL